MEYKSHFTQIDKTFLSGLVSVREGEVKLGQVVSTFEQLDSFTGKYVVVGVREDVGPRANLGLPGAANGFDAFIKRLVNIQSNRFFSGEDLLLYGVVDFSVDSDDVTLLRRSVAVLDSLLIEHLVKIYKKGLVPILIGGGHNNAYPLMKAYQLVTDNNINVINCDPHADFRMLEGRHSGNSFSYAMDQGVLSKYSVLGLHQSYNSEEMLLRMEDIGCYFTFFEDYLLGVRDFYSDVDSVFERYGDESVGVELDMDSIIGMPSSAFTPSGISLEQARGYVVKTQQKKSVVYLHLPEGGPKNDSESALVGKSLVYLVMDFMKA